MTITLAHLIPVTIRAAAVTLQSCAMTITRAQMMPAILPLAVFIQVFFVVPNTPKRSAVTITMPAP